MAPRPRRPLLRLAVAALHRPGARTGALVVALGLGLTLFVLLAAIRTSIDANIARTIPKRAPALFALDVPPEREAEFRRIVTAVEPRARIDTVPVMRGTITGSGTTRVADLEEMAVGADPAVTAPAFPGRPACRAEGGSRSSPRSGDDYT